jgi:hypothetical protein
MRHISNGYKTVLIGDIQFEFWRTELSPTRKNLEMSILASINSFNEYGLRSYYVAVTVLDI